MEVAVQQLGSSAIIDSCKGLQGPPNHLKVDVRPSSHPPCPCCRPIVTYRTVTVRELHEGC